MSKAKILVIGAGGLGCELLKDLALCGFRDIHVIDMDTIDVSNLNRQFLFRTKDVGQPKAIVAANFINSRLGFGSGVKVTPYFNKIQDFDETFYRTFNLIVCGLDNLAARRWISALLVQMVGFDEETGDILPDTIVPMIDGGSEGFRGHTRLGLWVNSYPHLISTPPPYYFRVYLPRISPCVECTIDLFPPKTTFPMCTIANTPRLPEHCIEWASIIEWPRVYPDTKKDNDNPDHVNWIYETALTRANSFNISGVTLKLTQGVIKNIIPAIASTNAIVSGMWRDHLI